MQIYGYPDEEALVSPRWLAGLYLFYGLLLVLASDLYALGLYRMEMLLHAVGLYAIAVVIWILDRRWYTAARWLAIGALIASAWLSASFWGYAVALSMVAVPGLLALAMLGEGAAIGFASLQTALCIAILPTARIEGIVLPWAIGAVWMSLSFLMLLSRPLKDRAAWAWHHFHQAQEALDEARDRSAQLERVREELLIANRQADLLNERLMAMRSMAEQAHRAKAAFVSEVSHEFRTPLNMIIGLIDLLMETPQVYGAPLPEPLWEDLRIVHRNCQHLSDLVNDVLDLSQAEADRLQLHKEWADPAEDIQSAAAFVQPLAEKKGLNIIVRVPESLPRVHYDRTRIRQVLLNLISNAARFTEQGRITVEAHCDGRHLTVSVADTGPGIPRQEADRIFEPFYQLGAGRARQGSGLGLSISRQFVEMHDGRLWLESEPGEGSVFSFSLPISSPEATPQTPARWMHEDWVWREREPMRDLPRLPRNPRIVACDPSGELARALRRAEHDLDIVEAPDLDALQRALRQMPAHAVLVNASSPDAAASVACAAMQLSQDSPVFACHLSPQIESALQAGATDYVVKPVTRADLESILGALPAPATCLLLVDNDPEFVGLLSRMLHSAHPELTICTAANGPEALDMLAQSPPDLVLLDVMMPGMNGWEVLDRIRQLPTAHAVPVVLVSAQDPSEHPPISPVLVAAPPWGIPPSQILDLALMMADRFLERPPERFPEPR